MTMKNTGWASITSCALLLVTMIFASVASAGRIGHGNQLDAQLGVRFTTPLADNAPQGTQLEGIVTSPEKLASFGLSSVKAGDRVQILVGPADSFSVRLGAQNLPLAVSRQGTIVRGGLHNAPALTSPQNAPNGLVVQDGKQNIPANAGKRNLQGGVR